MRHPFISSVTAACLALAASYASADTVTLDFKYPPASSVVVTDAAVPGFAAGKIEEAGELAGLLNGSSFVTFCAELTQDFVLGTTYTDYSVISAAAAGWSPATSTALDHAMSYFLGAGAPTGPVSSAVAQSAIWEIIYETTGTYAFGSGGMKIAGSDPATTSALASFDFSTVLSAPITYHVSELYSESHQDFLVASPVPEPSTYALILAGLAGVGFVARRRAQR